MGCFGAKFEFHQKFTKVHPFMVVTTPDVAGGRGSIGLKLRRWCLQKEMSASGIKRDRRKTPRWLYFHAVTAVSESHTTGYASI